VSDAAAPSAAHLDFDGDDWRLSDIVRRLVDELQPRAVYLFGSRARGDNRAHSDYDVLVVVDQKPTEPFNMQRRAYGSLEGVGVGVDVVVVTRKYFDGRRAVIASLPATVLREGRLLFGS
jgi:predicted nucleotidyltransferase